MRGRRNTGRDGVVTSTQGFKSSVNNSPFFTDTRNTFIGRMPRGTARGTVKRKGTANDDENANDGETANDSKNGGT